ncbi:hypothetical protein [Jeotgalibacillus sp. R-1-5s-1]|uniref:hypothetical protein n=1 Tax=Jeotgalibacillus sp. R-1-5s-1 TaxID=2555897 RepID=UPI00106BEAB0|nr:hypothetical protein [Jeotgalibacillus sp. R-1-5s-1]TFD97070.1 hypothetical protein E2491_10285 [Jeotgalibacillus sp. R-1-5s-1]
MTKVVQGFVFGVMFFVLLSSAGYAAAVDVEQSGNSNVFDIEDWNGGNVPLINGDGQNVVKGFYSSVEAFDRLNHIHFNVLGKAITTFNMKVSSTQNTAGTDYGKTTFSVYADDRLLVERFVPASGTQRVQTAIPRDTKKISVYVSHSRGANGFKTVLLEEPAFLNSGTYLPVTDNVYSLTSLASNEHMPFNDEGFMNASGTPVSTKSYSIKHFKARMEAVFPVSGLNVNEFEAYLSAEPIKTNERVGKKALAIYADDTLLFERQVKLGAAPEKISIKLPASTKNIRIVSVKDDGTYGVINTVLQNPIVKRNSAGYLANFPEKHALNRQPFTTNSLTKVSNHVFSQMDPLIYSNQTLLASGVAIGESSVSPILNNHTVTYNISGVNKNAFMANLSVDGLHAARQFGKTSVAIYADTTLLHTQRVSGTSGIIPLTLKIPAGASTLKVVTALMDATSYDKGQQLILGEAAFANLQTSGTIAPAQVTVQNNRNTTDYVIVKNLKKYDTIRVYDANKKLIVMAPRTTSTTGTAAIAQLGKTAGTLYISVAHNQMVEGPLTKVSFKGE